MMQSKDARRLVLLDAHAIIHRAYHAMPDFSSSAGEPTGALYGLSTMLMRIIEELRPTHLVACYDLPQKTHRHEVFKEYKAHRKKGDDALIHQIQTSRSVFEAFRIPIIECPGFEADDILGTIVEQTIDEKKMEIVIASGDMDTMQLIHGVRVRVYTLRKGIQDTVLYDEEAVKKRFGFSPTQIPDYKGFAGDSSDNIPGIKGIGEKTATELITIFGGVDGVYKALSKNKSILKESGFKPRACELIAAGEEEAQFSKMLATIRRDAPITFTLGAEYVFSSVVPAVISLCERYEFRSLVNRLRGKKGEGSTTVSEDPSQGSARKSTDETLLSKLYVMTWLLKSDITEPTIDDVLSLAKVSSAEDAYPILRSLIDARGMKEVYETIEEPLIPVVKRMNAAGVQLDVAYLSRLSKEYHEELDRISAEIYSLAGSEFNINSPKQLGDILYDTLAIKPIGRAKTPTGARSTKESDLQKIIDAHPIVSKVLEYRELQKLLSTYIDTLGTQVDALGRLHTTFQQTGTTTGRMSSIQPNLQNIPIKTDLGKRIRNAFVASEGKILLALDYAQIELRIAAILSEDPALVDAFSGGVDVHTAVASSVFAVEPSQVTSDMRRKAKVINFGILYGMGVNALRQTLGGDVTQSDARAYLDAYFAKYSRLAQWIDTTKAEAKRLGYTTTLFGRRRYFEGFNSALPFIRAAAERMAINAPIQGTQADLIKRAMVQADAFIEQHSLRASAQLVLQVHDELVYEVDKNLAHSFAKSMVEIMQGALEKDRTKGVPLIAAFGIGENWGETK